MTQFGRALAELNIEILCANSSQAKGRVERANRTLQDRLVKELRLAEHQRAWTPATTSCRRSWSGSTRRFAVPGEAENMHRRLNVQASRLADILCHREQRHVSQQLSLAYDRRQIILERSEVADKLAGQYVELYDFTRSTARGAMEGRLSSLSRLRKGPACQPHRHRREQAAQPRTRLGEGSAGLKHETEDPDQQRKGRLQEAPASSLRAGLHRKRARAKRGGNAGLRKAWKRTIKPSVPTLPTDLGNRTYVDFTHSHRTTTKDYSTSTSTDRPILTFLMG